MFLLGNWAASATLLELRGGIVLSTWMVRLRVGIVLSTWMVRWRGGIVLSTWMVRWRGGIVLSTWMVRRKAAGWRGLFDAGLLLPRLWVPPRPKSVDFHDAENRQRPCRMIIRHVKDP
ncbi:hypothetical protein TNCV_2586271 [Trichonephila clavipes]|nr:hypothetical protein TNCV_2586271 [Trichonephila clavipes]